MTIEEVSERYRIPLDILKEYESLGLCDTKVMGNWVYDDQDIEWLDFNPGRLSSEAIHREIDGTLKRLGTDYLDLYIIHRFDYDTPVEETMEAVG